MPREAELVRGALDRGLTALARLALRGFYRDLEVTGRGNLQNDRAMLVVANHFNALLDAVLVMHALGNLPRFVAKAALWSTPWARPLLALAGMVPVERAQDGGDTRRNQTTLADCAQQLARGRTVGLFPEGGLSETPALRPLKSGAARIALAARAAGAEAGWQHFRPSGSKSSSIRSRATNSTVRSRVCATPRSSATGPPDRRSDSW